MDVGRPVFFLVLIIICAFIPLLTLERVEGRLFTPMALTACYALLGSLILALTLIPALATYMYPRGVQTRHTPVLDAIARGYDRLLRQALRWRWLIVCLTVGLVITAVSVGLRLGTEFLSQLDEGVIWIRSNLLSEISLEKSAEITAKMRALIGQSPDGSPRGVPGPDSEDLLPPEIQPEVDGAK